MFERFTDRARRVVVLAQEEARLHNHNYIGTEHILLGLVHEGEGVAAKALESLGRHLQMFKDTLVVENVFRIVKEMDDDELARRLAELERSIEEARTLNPAAGKVVH